MTRFQVEGQGEEGDHQHPWEGKAGCGRGSVALGGMRRRTGLPGSLQKDGGTRTQTQPQPGRGSAAAQGGTAGPTAAKGWPWHLHCLFSGPEEAR